MQVHVSVCEWHAYIHATFYIFPTVEFHIIVNTLFSSISCTKCVMQCMCKYCMSGYVCWDSSHSLCCCRTRMPYCKPYGSLPSHIILTPVSQPFCNPSCWAPDSLRQAFLILNTRPPSLLSDALTTRPWSWWVILHTQCSEVIYSASSIHFFVN